MFVGLEAPNGLEAFDRVQRRLTPLLTAAFLAGRRQRVNPGIEHTHPRLSVIAHITGCDCEPVVLAGCSYYEIGLRKSVTDLSTLFDQKSPLEHDIFADWQYAMLEHRSQFVCQPVGKVRTLLQVR